ncbi:MAG: lipocalin-like domain-containing protein [Bacteroidaceae bacterium]|nr:lipocalin-like domain-containing protein [Bacteroidaceae bacterium]
MCNIKFGYLFFACVLFIVACQKADDNGPLGAFWKLLEVEYLADGSKNDLRAQNLFMAVQLNLMQFSGNKLHYARFQHQGDSLFIQMIGGDADKKFLESFGLNGQEQRFFVEKLNSKSLILKSEYSILRFKKF